MTVEVINRNRIDVTIYLLHEGSRDRIGVATAARTTCFPVDMRRLGGARDVQLIGALIGNSNQLISSRLHVRDRDRIIWELESEFDRSTANVRGGAGDC